MNTPTATGTRIRVIFAAGSGHRERDQPRDPPRPRHPRRGPARPRVRPRRARRRHVCPDRGWLRPWWPGPESRRTDRAVSGPRHTRPPDERTANIVAGRLVTYWPGREARARCPVPQARAPDERTANIVAGRLVPYWPGREARCTAGRCPALPHATLRRTYSEYRGRSARTLLVWTRGAVHRRAVSSPATGTTPQTNVQRISWPVGSYPIGLDARRGAPPGGVQPCHRREPLRRTYSEYRGRSARTLLAWTRGRCTAGGVQPCHRHDPSDERTAIIVAGRLVTYWSGREARCTAGRCPALPQARALRRTYSEYRGRSARNLLVWTRGAVHRRAVSSPATGATLRRTYSEYRGRSARNPIGLDAPGGVQPAAHRTANIVGRCPIGPEAPQPCHRREPQTNVQRISWPVGPARHRRDPQTNVQRISWPVGSYPIGLDARRGAPPGGVQPCHRHEPSDERTANIVAGRLVTYWPGREARCTAGRCPALPQARPLRRTYSEYRGRSARTLLAWTRGAVHRLAVSSPATGTTPRRTYSEYRGRTPGRGRRACPLVAQGATEHIVHLPGIGLTHVRQKPPTCRDVRPCAPISPPVGPLPTRPHAFDRNSRT